MVDTYSVLPDGIRQALRPSRTGDQADLDLWETKLG